MLILIGQTAAVWLEIAFLSFGTFLTKIKVSSSWFDINPDILIYQHKAKKRWWP